MKHDELMVRGFCWNVEVVNPDGSVAHRHSQFNRIPDAGLEFLVKAPFGDVSPIPAFYVGLFRGNYTPSANTTAADIPSNMQEFVDYSETERPLWDRLFEAPGTMDNLSSKAEVTVTQDRTLRGGFLCSDNVKGGNTGLVLSCLAFTTPVPVTAGQTVRVIAGLTYIPTNSI